MIIPRTPNAIIRHRNDPKFAGMKGRGSLFIENIPTVSVMGRYICGVGKFVSNPFLSTLFGNYELTIMTSDSLLLCCANSR